MDGRPLDLSAILVYPNAREVALSSLGFLKVHGMLAARAAVADFAYLPGPPPSPVLSPAQGLLLGERTRREARAFDFLGFSVSYENDYVNVVRLLDMAGIEPVGERRSEAFPFIVIGGFTMFMNPRPLAPLADAIVVGEAEPVLGEMLEILAAAKSSGWSRGRLRERVSSLRGVLVPGAGQAAVERVWAQPDSFAPEPAGLPAGGDAHFGDMRLVEVGRGCGRGCLFCAAGCLYRPVRMREAAEILNAAGRARRVGLVGPAVADHPDLEGMIEILVEGGARIGVSSLRADRVTARLAGLLAEGGMKTATIAPEIGLPGETDEDVRAIAGLVGRLAEVRGRSRLSVSAAPFVPKPGTPLEDAPFADMKVLRRRAGLLKAIRAIRGCTLKVASLESAWLEAALARADESMAPLMLEAVQKGVNLRTHLKRSGYESA
jgi:radical SAM superfamily enzyme YgiQ (UPF0313 family)